MRRLALALALSALFPAAAHAENGRIFYVVGAYSQFSTVMSACPGGTHVKNVMPLATFPSPSPDGTKIAYNKLDASLNNKGIWIADADGSNPVQIADGVRSDYWPTWSPDGTKLLFRRYVYYDEVFTSVMQPVVANVATKVITPLLNDRTVEMGSLAGPPAWTPDGSTIYFEGLISGSGSDVLRVPATGGTATRVLGTDAQLPFFQNIDFAPDGQSYVVSQTTTFDPTTLMENRRYLTNGGGGGELISEMRPELGVGDEFLSHSPDGTKIVFTRLPNDRLMVANPNGTGAVGLGALGGAHPRWSTNVDDCTDPGAATMKINEIGNGSVELLDSADETFPAEQAPYRVVAFNAAGARTGAHTISTALLQGRDNTKPLLLGPGGDEPLNTALSDPGQACFTRGAAETKVNCVSWGCIATPVTAASTRIPAPTAALSSQRQGIGSNVFHLAAPTPKAANVAGTAAPACAPPAGGQNPTPAPTPAPTPIAPPSKPPALKATGGKHKAGTVSFTLACAEAACTGKATLKVKKTTIGTAKVKLAAGKRTTLKVKLNAAGKKLFKRSRSVKATLTVTVAGGKPATRTVTLKR